MDKSESVCLLNIYFLSTFDLYDLYRYCTSDELSNYKFMHCSLCTCTKLLLLVNKLKHIHRVRIVDGDSILTYDINAEQCEVKALPIQPGYHILNNILYIHWVRSCC